MSLEETLAEIVTRAPEASQIFLRRRLDFCCGGQRSLAQACDEAGLDPQELAAELAGLAPAPPEARWDQAEPEALIEHILSAYHEPLRVDLPALVAAAQKVERVHAGKESCPRGLAALLERMDVEMAAHLAKEEQVLFPAVRRGLGGQPLAPPISVMRHEHDTVGRDLGKVRALTDDLRAPEEACATWRALYAGLTRLEGEIMAHVHLENNVLFPKILGAG